MSFTASQIFTKYGITDNNVVAIMMGQFSHECGGGTEMEENLNYSASRIRQVWPSRPNAVQYAHNPRMLANTVYGSRMGNHSGTDDGWNYRGRGLAQTTGRDEYAAMTRTLQTTLHIDFLKNPGLVNDPHVALEVGVANFIKCGCLPYAKVGNVQMVTKRLNGGYIGLAERQAWTRRWQAALRNVPLIDYTGVTAPALPPHITDPVLPPPPPEQKREAFVPETWKDWLLRKFF